MVQDIFTYTIVLYAVAYVVRSVAMMFVPEGKPLEKTSCSSCSGCGTHGECSPGAVPKKVAAGPRPG